MEALELAWGLIANASDWNMKNRTDWRKAAERWRDTHYHPHLTWWVSHPPQSTTHSNFGASDE
jgi:hypothetical protein